MEAARRAGIVICAWGTHGSLKDRGRNVLSSLRGDGIKAYAIKINAPGPITIDAQQTSGGATMKGIRYENATGADVVTNSVFGTVRAHMGNASHLAISCKTGGTNKVKNVVFGNLAVSPDFVDAATASWDATVIFGTKTVLPA